MNGIAGADQFMPSTRAFLDSLKKRPAPPKTRNPVDYVLMLGQSSVGWVFRTDRPIAEHSHEIFGPRHLGSAVGRTKSLLLELDEAQSKASTEPSDKADLRHDVKQVQGQILTPAMLLDEWKVPSLLGSVIAQDEDGLMIEQELNRRNHIDSTCVDRTPDLAATDRSYVPTFGGMRTTFDHSHTSVLAARDNAQTLVKRLNCKMQRPTKANPTALGPPRIAYVSKWMMQHVGRILDQLPQSRRRPIVIYETGTNGTPNFKDEKAQLGRYCDIVLASPIAAMKVLRAPLPFSGGGAEPPTVDCLFGAPDRSVTMEEWKSEFDRIQATEHQWIPFQHVAFLTIAAALGAQKIADTLFNEPIFLSARYWLVTMGEYGAMLFQRPRKHATKGYVAHWVKPPALSANITETPATFGISVGRWR